MAIVFEVEDGTGSASATSYLSTDEATDILSVNPVFTASWIGLTPTDQEGLLIWASQYLDQHVDWYGVKTVTDSGLRWPRYGIYDQDGDLVSDDIVPAQVKQATAQLAIFLQTSNSARSGGETTVIPEGIKRVKADVVEVEFVDNAAGDSRSGSDLLPVNIRYLIYGLGHIRTGKRRIARAIR